MKKLLCIALCVAMLLTAFPAVMAGETGETFTFDGVTYKITGENLFTAPNFIDGAGSRVAPYWYTGINNTTKWDAKLPNPNTGENLTPLADTVKGSEGEAKGKNAFYYSSGGAATATGSDYFLCEYITEASGCYWNGTRSLLCFLPIEGGKTYRFSYYVSSWGNTANSSVRFGAINSDTYGQNAADGKIVWSGSGGVNVDQYDGNNMTQKGSWTKKEALITADSDADYFFFNLYWLQDTNFVCLNGFTLEEAEALEITEVSSCAVSTYAGSEPKLPSLIGVTYEDGSTGTAPVTWDKTGYDIYRDGVYEIDGVVSAGNTTYGTTATVTVYSSSISPNYTVVRSLTDKDGILTGQLDIYTDTTADLTAAMALYDQNGTLQRVVAKRLAPSGSDSVTLTTPSPIYGSCTAKLFLWDSKTLAPLTKADAETISPQEGGQFMSISDVTLLDGMFKTAQDLNVNYLLAIEPDRLLAPCLKSSGLEPKGEFYGGWERYKYNNWAEGHGISGHSLGHWMSAVSTAWQATGNTQLKANLDYAVSELANIQETTGSGYVGGVYPQPFEQAFSGNVSVPDGFNLNGTWVPWYSVHKIYQGLIDAYVNTGNQQALDVVTKFADWAVEGISHMTDSQMQTMLNAEHGGMNDVFAQLYSITGNEDYLTAAVRFTHNSILTPLSQGKDELTGKHANTQIPKIIGAAAIYEGDENRTDYKNASEFFWNTVVNNRSFVIGGNSVSEHFEALGAETLHKKTCETCNTYNMIKLTEHLYSWEHDSKYMDYVETALYNDILGAQDPLTGNKMYFTSLLQGHYRVYGTPENSWWCCTGSGMENPGRYAKCIYYKDLDDLYVNLYIPSQVKWNETGLTLRTETDFPYSDKVKITVVDGNAKASINLRAPGWLAGNMSVSVSGEEYSCAGGGYLTLNRDWKAGDEIEITLPMGLSVYTARDSENKVAFLYGPIVLGAPLGTQSGDVTLPKDTQESELGIPDTTVPVPSLKTESNDPYDFITAEDLSKLTFSIDGKYTSSGQTLTLVPFYSIHHQFHNVYWYLNAQADPYEKALNDITTDSVTPDGQQDEIGHLQQGTNSHCGSFTSGITTYYWRDAYGSADAYFSYEMEVDPEAQNYLYVSYWGDDGDFKTYTRSFDILANGEKIASQTLNRNNPGKPYNVFYTIPKELTAGKEKITVKFAVQNDKTCAGGVLDVRITSAGKVEI